MGVLANRFYNDPAMAQAAQNIASLFAPPSGSDASGYANARKTNEEANRLAELFAYSKSPSFDRGTFDREAVGGGLYLPTQSFYSVDQGNATTRYGYDKSLEGTEYTANQRRISDLYATDVDAKTKAAIDAADNARLLQTNRETALLAPVAENATRFIPPAIATEQNLPPTQTGVVNVAPGEVANLPSGKIITGEKKPLTLEEVRGGTLTDLIMAAKQADPSGALADELMKQSVMGTETSNIVNDKGEVVMTPRFATTGKKPVLSETDEKGRVIAGLSPAEQKLATLGTKTVSVVGTDGQPVLVPEFEAGQRKPYDGTPATTDNYVAKGPDGKEHQFVGYVGGDHRIHDVSNDRVVDNVTAKITSSGQTIRVNPDGSVDIIQGGGGGAKPTESERRSAYVYDMASAPVARLEAAYDDPAKLPNATDMTIWPSLNQMARSESLSTAAIGRLLNDQAISAPGREFFLDLMNELPLELMEKSGLATTQTDWASSLYAVVPQPNDTPEMRKRRKEHLDSFLKATHRAAGPALPQDGAGATAELCIAAGGG